jgi:hypothetical protein
MEAIFLPVSPQASQLTATSFDNPSLYDFELHYSSSGLPGLVDEVISGVCYSIQVETPILCILHSKNTCKISFGERVQRLKKMGKKIIILGTW